ncbi:uncharacterized protein N7469_008620 [Penicillium citrinum]|uniref:Uncharacterized protein n=2 Tax=Penicillium TaxID=5073 RepID=A0A9W9TIC1_PENCI|nr:uncharacterized protein N7469_008620 [Penicillium citrinum]KAJ5222380.1 hypothetical protein N7469_008620 [Penicillium citrinum]KAJ5580536.1 hypothetical protein N7450_006837 [Penicillium hetheringtonii]KAK5788829.1 hypothetical protein VI817_009787 [Penicillium citrinum]
MSAFRGARTANVQARGFSTTSTNLRVKAGPESPHFLDIPRIIQPGNPVKPRVKGTLPVPRELFPVRRTDKPSKQYVDEVSPTRTSKPARATDELEREQQLFKMRMADRRRNHLRDSLKVLHERKLAAEKTMVTRSRMSQERRQRIFKQPEAEDERLTRPSMVSAMLAPNDTFLRDANREQRLAFSKARLEAKQAQKKAQHQDDLHSLYIHARTFITTEEQLSAEIDRVFPDGENVEWRNDHQPGENVWNLGAPPTVQSAVSETRKSETARWDVTQDRVKKLGEQITGGKL